MFENWQRENDAEIRVMLEDGTYIIMSYSPTVYYTNKAAKRVVEELKRKIDTTVLTDSIVSSAPKKEMLSSTSVESYTSPEFGAIRIVMIDGEPWLVGKDIASILGYADTAQAIRKHVDEEDKGVVEMTTPGGKQKVTIINESGLYSLVLSSKLQTAKNFRRWVTSEVLPSIRKHGGYIYGQEQMTSEELLSRAILFAKSKIEELENQNKVMAQKIEIDAPKVEFAESVQNADNGVTVEQFAKSTYSELSLGRNKTFSMMRDLHILQSKPKKSRNIPYQEYINCGYFIVVEKYNDKRNETYYQTMITGRGQLWLLEKLKAAQVINIGGV